MSARGPWIASDLSISNSAVVRLMGLVTWPGVMSKVIVAPGHACRIVLRNEPAPLLLLFATTVGPQATLMVAVARPPPSPAVVLLVEACTWKLPSAFEFSAGVNLRPALPSAKFMKSLLLICVVPLFLNKAPPLMLVILKLVTSVPSEGLRLIINPEVVCVLTVVDALVTDGVSAIGLTVIVKLCGADVSWPPLAVPPLSTSTIVMVAMPFAFGAG